MEETTIVINVKIPSSEKNLIRAIRRAVGFFKAIVETSEKITKKA